MYRPRNSGIMMAILLTAAGSQVQAGSLPDMLKSSSRNGAYVAPTAFEVQQAEALFQRCFAKCDDQAVIQGWQQLGFEVLQAEHGGQLLTVIREKSDARQGRGFYVFYPESNGSTVLEAPHSFKDENTREIQLSLLAEGRFRAAAWNTVPRHYEQNGMKVDADMAHLQGTYFLAFSRAFASHLPAGKLVQLHGFARGKRRSGDGSDADMVVSSGSQVQTDTMLKLGRCLQGAELGKIRLYPTEIRELGATTNSIGNALRAQGHAGFVHIEMSAQTRLSLLNDKGERAKLLRCLEK